ncbi:MAG TPA: UvrD-helicase domain-containing protein, partial [Thermomicrobiales bacterium]|nr:UvrD-helicase domain-containing protein [Thermomicrobiales bacterium]
MLVVAGPGSGKTRVLTHRIAWLIERERVYPSEILAVTFTNKAAREMRTRVEALLGGRELAGLTMGTFHSFGVRLLRQNPGLVADRLGVLPNFVIYDDADQADIAKKSIVAVGLDPKMIAPRRVLSRVSAAKSLMLTPEEFANAAETYDDEVIARIYKEYERALRKANAVDFDDLLALPIRLFDAAPSVLERYQQQFRHILVDEYQDTNRVQYVLVAALADKHRNLFVVGDPDQSIYGWRQADIRNILDFKTDYPDAREIHLELNYRSTRRIVETADRVIRDNTQRIDRRLRTDNEDGERIILRELSDGQHEAQFIVDEIRRLTTRDGFRFDDAAVMYRTGAQSRVLEEAFRRSEIAYRIVGGVRFYERKEVKDILAALRLLYNPSDEISLERVIGNYPIGKGIGPKALDAIRTWATLQGRSLLDGFIALAPSLEANHSAPDLVGSGRTAAQKVGVAFAELRDEAGRLTMAELFDAIVERTGYRAGFDQESEEDLERWANVLEVRADMERYDLLPPGEALPTYLEQVTLVSAVDEMEDDPKGRVTLITLHSAKGLEFPVVFIAGVEEGLLPISRAIEAEFGDPAPMEEERRLFYVGITRAEKRLYLTLAGGRATYGRWQASEASRFLAAVPEQHLHTLGRRDPSRLAPTPRGTSLGDRVRQRAIDDWAPPAAPERAPAATATSVPAVAYASGQRVFHPKFGEGIVLEAVERRGEQELSIDFKRHG